MIPYRPYPVQSRIPVIKNPQIFQLDTYPVHPLLVTGIWWSVISLINKVLFQDGTSLKEYSLKEGDKVTENILCYHYQYCISRAFFNADQDHENSKLCGFFFYKLVPVPIFFCSRSSLFGDNKLFSFKHPMKDRCCIIIILRTWISILIQSPTRTAPNSFFVLLKKVLTRYCLYYQTVFTDRFSPFRFIW